MPLPPGIEIAIRADFVPLDTVGQVGGVPGPLDSSGHIPVGQLPPGLPTATLWGGITGTLADQADLQAALSAKLDATLKGAVNGLAELGGDGKVPNAQLPDLTAPVWGSITGTLGNQTDVQSAINGRVATSQLGVASGVATLGADGRLAASQRPQVAWGDLSGTITTQADLVAQLSLKISTSTRAAANGVCDLDATTQVPMARLKMGTANGVCELGNDGTVPDARISNRGEWAYSETAATGTITRAITVLRTGATSRTLPTISATSIRDVLVINEASTAVTISAGAGQTIRGAASTTVPANSSKTFVAVHSGTNPTTAWATIP